MGARIKSISNFRAFTGLQYLNFADNSISTFSMSGTFPNFTSINLGRNRLTSIDVSNLNTLVNLSLSQNPITNVDISNNINLNSVSIGNCELTETSVNNILIQLDNNGLLTGFCYIAAGTNAAPTGTGIIASNNLILKGWTVTTN